jgi:hypothetical protein
MSVILSLIEGFCGEVPIILIPARFVKPKLSYLVNSREAERQIYRTTTVGQLVAALVESRDHTDIRNVFAHHEGGTRGFGIACQRLGISRNDWDYANNAAGFYALIATIAQKLGPPRYDPAAEQARLRRRNWSGLKTFGWAFQLKASDTRIA